MPKILVVEDAADLARLIARELGACNFDVIIAENGVDALELEASQHPDLIILDWVLPLMDGLEVLRRLRQSSPVPVLMLTGRDQEIDRVVGLEVGADDYLVKPFSMRELLARTRAMLRRVELIQRMQPERTPGTTSSGPVQFEALRLDPQTHVATLRGATIELSRTEFDLLYLFLRHPGQAFERSYLLETVWGEPYLEHDRSVDNVILRLRRKIEPLGDAIETVRGVGYRWRAE